MNGLGLLIAVIAISLSIQALIVIGFFISVNLIFATAIPINLATVCAGILIWTVLRSIFGRRK